MILRLRRHCSILFSLGCALTTFISTGCVTEGKTVEPHGPFKIVVVGAALNPNGTVNEKNRPLNRAEALAMLDGVNEAWRLTFGTKPANMFTLKTFDDDGNADTAARIADAIRSDPTVLAVVGHSLSGVTKRVAPIYSTASIPLLMPIATSPEARSRTSFRLPLNDDVGQAPAIVHLLADLNVRHVMLVTDKSEDAKAYSDALERFVTQRLPAPLLAGREHVDLLQPNFASIAEDVASSVEVNGVDAVLFVGYASTAVRLLGALRSRFEHSTAALPKIILTDGCIAPDLPIGRFEVYLTAPIPDLRLPTAALQSADLCDGARVPQFRERFGNRAMPNYEIFGFDAISLLASAVDACEATDSVSRSCVQDQLASGRGSGLCNKYVFHDGENRDGAYYVYNVCHMADAVVMTLWKRYSLEALGNS
jgi:ABC-type branched-subunit amino acid transport system substrate-binding protein